MSSAQQFGRFSLDARECRLLRDGQPVPLSPKPFDLLVALANRPGQLMSREDLLREVWKGVAVEPTSLKAAMSVLRQALGDDDGAIIETVPGRGYRFIAPIAPVVPIGDVAPTAPVATIRVAIVDDHDVVRLGVRAVVSQLPGFVVCGDTGSLDDAAPMIQSSQPDLLILDLMMGDESSLPRIKSWRGLVPALRVIVLSMHSEDDYARQALVAGASGFVMKSEMSDELSDAIVRVTAGDVWLSAKLSRAILKEFAEQASR